MFLATSRIDGRKGINGLSAMVRSQFSEDPLSGTMFVFFTMRAAPSRRSRSTEHRQEIRWE